MSHQNASVKSILFALLANLGITITKTVAAVITGSGAMLAESIHSYADCGNQGLLFLGLHATKKKPDTEHPLGYGKEIFFWSFVVALILFSMGGLFSIYEGIHKVRLHEGLKSPMIAVVVLGEDIAALLGLSFALISVVLSILTGNPIFDAIGSIGIGVLLITISFFLAVKVKSLLIGQSADSETCTKIQMLLESRPEIEQILNLITLQLGPQIMVAVKAKMTKVNSVDQLIKNINTCESELKKENSAIRWVFFEPDIIT